MIEEDVWNTLYRAYDERDILLYVGISSTPMLRLIQHTKVARWAMYAAKVTFERFATRSAVEEAERVAIRTERPVFNIAYAEDVSRSFEYLQDRYNQGLFVEWPPPKHLGSRRSAPAAPKKSAPPEVRPLLTTADAAELLGISEQTLKEWRKSKTGLDYYLLPSGIVRYEREVVEQWKALRIAP